MIYFFYGEETWHGWHAVKKMRENFKVENNGTEAIIFDCDEELNIGEILEKFGAQDLFSQKKMIVLRNFLKNTKVDEQKKVITSLEKSDDEIIFWEESAPRKNSALYKWLIKNADKTEENIKLDGRNLDQWIENCTKENGCTITPDAIRELILYIGDDLWRVENEIQKLSSYVDQKEITAEDVQMLVHGKVHADMFEAIESVTMGNVSRALHLLKKQIAKGDEAFHIFSMYAYQVRTLLLVSGAVEQVGSDRTAVAKTVKVHPFVAQKSIAMLQRMDAKRVKKMHRVLTQLDYEVKNGLRGIEDALDYFVVNA